MTTAYASPRTIHAASPRTSLFRTAVLFLFLIAVFLSPSLEIVSGIYNPRGEDIVLALVVTVWLLTIPRRRITDLHFDSRWNAQLSAILFGMLYVAIISICVGAIVFHQRLIVNDMLIVPMLIRYWLIVQIGTWYGSGQGRAVFFWAFLVSVTILAFVGIFQYFDMFGVNYWLTPIYRDDSLYLLQLQTGVSTVRVVGTVGDPRHYAYLLVVGIGFCIAVVVNHRVPWSRYGALALMLPSFFALGLTASRTGVLSLVVILLSAFLLLRRTPGRFGRLFSLLIFAAVLLALILPVLQTSAFGTRVLDTESASLDASLSARQRDLIQPFILATREPIIWLTGRGPSKAEIRTNSHNDFGWYFYRFGIPGLALYLLLLTFGTRMSLQAWRLAEDPMARLMSMTSLFAMVNWIVFAMAENIFKHSQLMPLNMVLIGACIGLLTPRHSQN